MGTFLTNMSIEEFGLFFATQSFMYSFLGGIVAFLIILRTPNKQYDHLRGFKGGFLLVIGLPFAFTSSTYVLAILFAKYLI
ncbi:MAG: hypothetical protein R2730_02395 [Chitinophagales bacterium]